MTDQLPDPSILYRCAVTLEGDDARYECDVIYEFGQFWLVPHWLTYAEGLARPARLIALARMEHEQTPGAASGDFSIIDPLPRVLFDDPAPSPQLRDQYAIVEMPEILRVLQRHLN